MPWIGAVVGVAGSMLKDDGSGGGGGGGGATNETARSETSGGSSSQSYVDPRMEEILYGTGGIIPQATDWWNNNSSGTNEQMITGMNNTWNQLGASGQGYNQMQNLGMQLMGGGAAGNPFTGTGGVAAQQVQYTPATFSAGTENPFVQKEQKPLSVLPQASSGGGGGGGGALETAMQAIAAPTPAPPDGFWIDNMGNAFYGGSRWEGGL